MNKKLNRNYHCKYMSNYMNRPVILYRRFRKEMLLLPLSFTYKNYSFEVLTVNIHDFLLRYNEAYQNNPKNQLRDLIFPISLYSKKNNKFLNLVIRDMEHYPFKSPNILLNNKPLIKYYSSNLFIKYKKYFEKRNCCLICSSLLSEKKWCVLTHFRDIINEMIINFVDISRAIEMLHMEKILNKYVCVEDLISYALDFI